MGRATAVNGVLDVPVIDISAWAGGTAADRDRIAAEVDRAARTVGFMQIAGHGVPDAAVDAFAAAQDAFFGLPMAEKKALRAPSPDVNRGYTPPRTERLSLSLGVPAAAEDLFEAFNVGAEAAAFPGLGLPEEHYPANIWPPVPGFRDAVEEWCRRAGGLARRLTGIFAHALGLAPDHFTPFTDHSLDVLRMNHYALPERELVIDRDQMGMGAHTDYGIVTVLWADRVPGLQILDTEGRWHDVRPEPGCLLVNLGDLLARWTNDRWLSTLHRVLPPADATGRVGRRRSAAFFHDGNWDAEISCLPGCAPAGAEPLYPPTTVGRHLAEKLGGSRAGKLNANSPREAARLLAARTEGR
ncbi:isopenicillin N synthase family oxygenase [Streptomyces sp. RS10V-4]|uniref:isopenicillin N synthase family dioxygenase n=1 Tax=Streptomyces rhizoryzae TaxID=2932493 RepID=UPI0020041809|nr:2-oxoglutarate and iron-dependent oxygenase domain-containing protein [Streptomyces rhizoryzae]MCK7627129.1 isopenicillin N synthase family oxygenase [Streptomyces rhizoryzae]